MALFDMREPRKIEKCINDPEKVDRDIIRTHISYIRKKLLVHSIIYYRLNESLVSDDQWARWALELEELTQTYPDLAQEAFLAEEFKNFDHSTGYNLPLETPWAVDMAIYLVNMHKRYGTRWMEAENR